MDMNRYSSVEQLIGDAIRESARTAEVIEIEPRDAEAEIVRHFLDASEGGAAYPNQGFHEFWGVVEDEDDARHKWMVRVVLGGDR